jgi:hypothetical protein
MATGKADDLSPTHLKWLVKSRAANQEAALGLFNLFEQYPEQLKSAGLSRKAQSLVAACFSLWRAAFLADKTVYMPCVPSEELRNSISIRSLKMDFKPL